MKYPKASRLLINVAIAMALLHLGSTLARAERRVALVIGNATYLHVPPLKNAANDATQIAKMLKEVGFEATLLLNGGKAEIEEAIRRFGSELDGADVGLFYYSGHGFQAKGRVGDETLNHIDPIDFHPPAEKTFSDTVPLQDILSLLRLKVRIGLVFWDAGLYFHEELTYQRKEPKKSSIDPTGAVGEPRTDAKLSKVVKPVGGGEKADTFSRGMVFPTGFTPAPMPIQPEARASPMLLHLKAWPSMGLARSAHLPKHCCIIFARLVSALMT